MAAVWGSLNVLYERGAQQNIFNLFCGQDFSYRLNVTIEVDGKQYSSKVVGSVSHPRINTGGACADPIGSILPFRIDDNRLVLLYARICDRAVGAFADRQQGNPASFAESMSEHRKLDVAQLCTGLIRNRPLNSSGAERYDGFIIDDADNPKHWRGFSFDQDSNSEGTSGAEHFRLVSAIAEAANLWTEDGLETIAPAILKTQFVYGDWSMSPDPMFSSRRRYGEVLEHTATEQRP